MPTSSSTANLGRYLMRARTGWNVHVRYERVTSGCIHILLQVNTVCKSCQEEKLEQTSKRPLHIPIHSFPSFLPPSPFLFPHPLRSDPRTYPVKIANPTEREKRNKEKKRLQLTNPSIPSNVISPFSFSPKENSPHSFRKVYIRHFNRTTSYSSAARRRRRQGAR
jgi:hypothetical protein